MPPPAAGLPDHPVPSILFTSALPLPNGVSYLISTVETHCTEFPMATTGLSYKQSLSFRRHKRVMVLVNLKPAKLAGVVSEGMLLCAEDEKGELAVMIPEKRMPSGAEIC